MKYSKEHKSYEKFQHKRTLVCGGRAYWNEELVFEVLNNLCPEFLIQGGSAGADNLARKWAKEQGCPQAIVPAYWSLYGSSAGPRRNAWMITYLAPQIVVAFPGEAGTMDMIRKAVAANLPILEVS